jgi:hypothetical protein
MRLVRTELSQSADRWPWICALLQPRAPASMMLWCCLVIVLVQVCAVCAFAPAPSAVNQNTKFMSHQRHARCTPPPLYSFYRREVIDFEELLGIKTQGYKDITVVDAVQVKSVLRCNPVSTSMLCTDSSPLLICAGLLFQSIGRQLVHCLLFDCWYEADFHYMPIFVMFH